MLLASRNRSVLGSVTLSKLLGLLPFYIWFSHHDCPILSLVLLQLAPQNGPFKLTIKSKLIQLNPNRRTATSHLEGTPGDSRHWALISWSPLYWVTSRDISELSTVVWSLQACCYNKTRTDAFARRWRSSCFCFVLVFVCCLFFGSIKNADLFSCCCWGLRKPARAALTGFSRTCEAINFKMSCSKNRTLGNLPICFKGPHGDSVEFEKLLRKR